MYDLLLRSPVPPPLVTRVQLNFPHPCFSWPLPWWWWAPLPKLMGADPLVVARDGARMPGRRHSAWYAISMNSTVKYKKLTHNFHFAKYYYFLKEYVYEHNWTWMDMIGSLLSIGLLNEHLRPFPPTTSCSPILYSPSLHWHHLLSSYSSCGSLGAPQLL
jgi:hypothetical protein